MLFFHAWLLTKPMCTKVYEQHFISYIQNHLSVMIKSTIHHEVFTAGVLEARVHRMIAFRHQLGKPSDVRWILSLHRVVLYLLYTQPEISFNYCRPIIA